MVLTYAHTCDSCGWGWAGAQHSSPSQLNMITQKITIMAQSLYYIEVVTTQAHGGPVVDVHESQSGGLPILYRSEKKAKNRASRLRRLYWDLGYKSIDTNALPPYKLLSPTKIFETSITIREVPILT